MSEAAGLEAPREAAAAALPEPPLQASAPPPAPEPARPRGARLAWLAFVIALLALVASLWQAWDTRSRAKRLHEELARRLADADAVARDVRQRSQQVQEALAPLQGKIGALETRVEESRSQQLALDAMYQELTRHRDDRVLAEVEQAVNLAAQQLQLAGNVQAALVALQTADERLARSEQMQYLALRKALNQDIERLKGLPLVDVPGLALKIESVVGRVDDMLLAYEGRLREPAADGAADAADGFWSKLWQDLWRELSQLVRVQRLDRPDPAVLSPQHAFILREHLKLRLMNARLALLQRDGQTYRQDLGQARAWVQRYFDLRSRPVQEALATLDALSATEIVLALPALDDSLDAVRKAKLGREQRNAAP
jgi:uroporphyrin-3 C-methyltransferase